MQHQTTQALVEYWNAIRGDRPAPRRSEIEPRDIKRILPYVFILERQDHWSFRFRLAGTGLCNVYGTEFRRQNMLGLWQDECHTNMTHLLNDVTGSAAAGVLEYTAETGEGRHVSFEMVLLPLAQDNGALTRIIGAAVPLENPAWLGDQMLTRQWIDRIQLIDPDQMPKSTAAALAPRIARQAPPRIHAGIPSLAARRQRLSGERPYLRLIKSEVPNTGTATGKVFES